MNTIVAAAAFITDGEGDQVLVAEGTTDTGGVPNFYQRSGFSAAYPTVLSTYDPADPTNESKLGRGDQRSARPQLTGQSGIVHGGHTSGAVQYVAIKGFDLNFPNSPNQALQFFPNGGSQATPTGDGISYLLIENNIFRYIGLTVDMAYALNGTPATHIILRNNAIYGVWGNTNDKAGNSFVDGWANITFEDNVWYHNGWKIGALRDDSYTVGGVTIFNHQFYVQSTNPGPFIFRRNLDMDGAADGGQFRTTPVLLGNVFIDNPTSMAVGGGSQYYIYQPNGVNFQVSYNAVLGGADINSGNPAYIGVTNSNGQFGSAIHHNLYARSNNPSGPNAITFKTEATYNQPSNVDFHHNIGYLWSSSTNAILVDTAGYPAQCFPTYENNVWDNAASGSNVNVSSISPPNPYTDAQLYSALTATFPSITDKASLVTYVTNHPEAHVQRTMLSLLQAGYGIDTSGMVL